MVEVGDSATVTPATDSAGEARDPAGLIRRRRAWSYGLIRKAAAPVPPYGSAAWFRLPEGSPERIASVVVAAEQHARSGDTLVEDLRYEVEQARREFKAREDEDYAERARVHREQYGDLSRDDVAVLADRRRRRIAEARKPRAGDRRGIPTQRGGAS